MEPVARPMRALIDLNTDLVLNCLDGLEEADGTARIAAGTNNIAFLVAHIADARFSMATLLGHALENPLEEALAGVTSVDETRTLPSLDELRGIWIAVSGHVTQCVDAASAAQWSAPSGSPYAFPIDDQTLLGAVAFLVQHESYHLGQIGVLRKAGGHAAMSYRRAAQKEAGG